MKIFTILLICIFHGIRGNEDVLKEAINRGVTGIQERQEALKKEFSHIHDNIFSILDKTNTEFIEEANQVAKDFKDQEQITAFESFKVAFNQLIVESKDSVKKITDRYPELIVEYYAPLKIAQDAYNKVEKAVTDLKKNSSENSCKENHIQKLVDIALTTISSVTDCIYSGASNVPSSPFGIRYIKNEIPKFAIRAISLSKRCQHEVGAKCTDRVMTEIATEKEKVKKFGDNQPAYGTQKEVVKSCVYRKLHPFQNEAAKAVEEMKKC